MKLLQKGRANWTRQIHRERKQPTKLAAMYANEIGAQSAEPLGFPTLSSPISRSNKVSFFRKDGRLGSLSLVGTFNQPRSSQNHLRSVQTMVGGKAANEVGFVTSPCPPREMSIIEPTKPVSRGKLPFNEYSETRYEIHFTTEKKSPFFEPESEPTSVVPPTERTKPPFTPSGTNDRTAANEVGSTELNGANFGGFSSVSLEGGTANRTFETETSGAKAQLGSTGNPPDRRSSSGSSPLTGFRPPLRVNSPVGFIGSKLLRDKFASYAFSSHRNQLKPGSTKPTQLVQFTPPMKLERAFRPEPAEQQPTGLLQNPEGFQTAGSVGQIAQVGCGPAEGEVDSNSQGSSLGSPSFREFTSPRNFPPSAVHEVDSFSDENFLFPHDDLKSSLLLQPFEMYPKERNFIGRTDNFSIQIASSAQIERVGTREKLETREGRRVRVRYGEVENSETVSYKDFKQPHPGGLYCDRTFGPVKNWVCTHPGCSDTKKGILPIARKGNDEFLGAPDGRGKYRELKCSICGNGLYPSNLRRYRMGYIHLYQPLVHVSYIHSRQNLFAHLLRWKTKEIHSLIYNNLNLINFGHTELLSACFAPLFGFCEDSLGEALEWLRGDYFSLSDQATVVLRLLQPNETQNAQRISRASRQPKGNPTGPEPASRLRLLGSAEKPGLRANKAGRSRSGLWSVGSLLEELDWGMDPVEPMLSVETGNKVRYIPWLKKWPLQPDPDLLATAWENSQNFPKKIESLRVPEFSTVDTLLVEDQNFLTDIITQWKKIFYVPKERDLEHLEKFQLEVFEHDHHSLPGLEYFSGRQALVDEEGLTITKPATVSQKSSFEPILLAPMAANWTLQTKPACQLTSGAQPETGRSCWLPSESSHIVGLLGVDLSLGLDFPELEIFYNQTFGTLESFFIKPESLYSAKFTKNSFFLIRDFFTKFHTQFFQKKVKRKKKQSGFQSTRLTKPTSLAEGKAGYPAFSGTSLGSLAPILQWNPIQFSSSRRFLDFVCFRKDAKEKSLFEASGFSISSLKKSSREVNKVDQLRKTETGASVESVPPISLATSPKVTLEQSTKWTTLAGRVAGNEVGAIPEGGFAPSSLLSLRSSLQIISKKLGVLHDAINKVRSSGQTSQQLSTTLPTGVHFLAGNEGSFSPSALKEPRTVSDQLAPHLLAMRKSRWYGRGWGEPIPRAIAGYFLEKSDVFSWNQNVFGVRGWKDFYGDMFVSNFDVDQLGWPKFHFRFGSHWGREALILPPNPRKRPYDDPVLRAIEYSWKEWDSYEDFVFSKLSHSRMSHLLTQEKLKVFKALVDLKQASDKKLSVSVSYCPLRKLPTAVPKSEPSLVSKQKMNRVFKPHIFSEPLVNSRVFIEYPPRNYFEYGISFVEEQKYFIPPERLVYQKADPDDEDFPKAVYQMRLPRFPVWVAGKPTAAKDSTGARVPALRLTSPVDNLKPNLFPYKASPAPANFVGSTFHSGQGWFAIRGTKLVSIHGDENLRSAKASSRSGKLQQPTKRARRRKRSFWKENSSLEVGVTSPLRLEKVLSSLRIYNSFGWSVPKWLPLYYNKVHKAADSQATWWASGPTLKSFPFIRPENTLVDSSSQLTGRSGWLVPTNILELGVEPTSLAARNGSISVTQSKTARVKHIKPDKLKFVSSLSRLEGLSKLLKTNKHSRAVKRSADRTVGPQTGEKPRWLDLEEKFPILGFENFEKQKENYRQKLVNWKLEINSFPESVSAIQPARPFRPKAAGRSPSAGLPGAGFAGCDPSGSAAVRSLASVTKLGKLKATNGNRRSQQSAQLIGDRRLREQSSPKLRLHLSRRLRGLRSVCAPEGYWTSSLFPQVTPFQKITKISKSNYSLAKPYLILSGIAQALTRPKKQGPKGGKILGLAAGFGASKGAANEMGFLPPAHPAFAQNLVSSFDLSTPSKVKALLESILINPTAAAAKDMKGPIGSILQAKSRQAGSPRKLAGQIGQLDSSAGFVHSIDFLPLGTPFNSLKRFERSRIFDRNDILQEFEDVLGTENWFVEKSIPTQFLSQENEFHNLFAFLEASPFKLKEQNRFLKRFHSMFFNPFFRLFLSRVKQSRNRRLESRTSPQQRASTQRSWRRSLRDLPQARGLSRANLQSQETGQQPTEKAGLPAELLLGPANKGGLKPAESDKTGEPDRTEPVGFPAALPPKPTEGHVDAGKLRSWNFSPRGTIREGDPLYNWLPSEHMMQRLIKLLGNASLGTNGPEVILSQRPLEIFSLKKKKTQTYYSTFLKLLEGKPLLPADKKGKFREFNLSKVLQAEKEGTRFALTTFHRQLQNLLFQKQTSNGFKQYYCEEGATILTDNTSANFVGNSFGAKAALEADAGQESTKLAASTQQSWVQHSEGLVGSSTLGKLASVGSFLQEPEYDLNNLFDLRTPDDFGPWKRWPEFAKFFLYNGGPTLKKYFRSENWPKTALMLRKRIRRADPSVVFTKKISKLFETPKYMGISPEKWKTFLFLKTNRTKPGLIKEKLSEYFREQRALLLKEEKRLGREIRQSEKSRFKDKMYWLEYDSKEPERFADYEKERNKAFKKFKREYRREEKIIAQERKAKQRIKAQKLKEKQKQQKARERAQLKAQKEREKAAEKERKAQERLLAKANREKQTKKDQPTELASQEQPIKLAPVDELTELTGLEPAEPNEIGFPVVDSDEEEEEEEEQRVLSDKELFEDFAQNHHPAYKKVMRVDLCSDAKLKSFSQPEDFEIENGKQIAILKAKRKTMRANLVYIDSANIKQVFKQFPFSPEDVGWSTDVTKKFSNTLSNPLWRNFLIHEMFSRNSMRGYSDDGLSTLVKKDLVWVDFVTYANPFHIASLRKNRTLSGTVRGCLSRMNALLDLDRSVKRYDLTTRKADHKKADQYYQRFDDYLKALRSPKDFGHENVEINPNFPVKKRTRKILEKKRLVKHYRAVLTLLKNPSCIERGVFDKFPILPPDLRPILQIGDVKAVSDMTALYILLIQRNIRHGKILFESYGESNEFLIDSKTMVQIAADNALDKCREKNINNLIVGRMWDYKDSENQLEQWASAKPKTKGAGALGGALPPRTLYDRLSGKEGRFRMNLLGKRVDYSGRSVIIVGPSLNVDQCGVPYEMALELFQPFVLRYMMEDPEKKVQKYLEYDPWISDDTTLEHLKSASLRPAAKATGLVRPEVQSLGVAGTSDEVEGVQRIKSLSQAKLILRKKKALGRMILRQIVPRFPVLLNRAPTLHRLGIQGFHPVLVYGRALHLHPLVCGSFNADFDGDQMAIHIPLSLKARFDIRMLMFAPVNWLSPATGQPTVVPSQDMVLGLFYMTLEKIAFQKGRGAFFQTLSDAVQAYQTGMLEIQSQIWIQWNGPFANNQMNDESSEESYDEPEHFGSQFRRKPFFPENQIKFWNRGTAAGEQQPTKLAKGPANSSSTQILSKNDLALLRRKFHVATVGTAGEMTVKAPWWHGLSETRIFASALSHPTRPEPASRLRQLASVKASRLAGSDGQTTKQPLKLVALGHGNSVRSVKESWYETSRRQKRRRESSGVKYARKEGFFYHSFGRFANDEDEPLEIRVHQNGISRKIYADFQWSEDSKEEERICYIRTTPGRAMINQLIYPSYREQEPIGSFKRTGREVGNNPTESSG